MLCWQITAYVPVLARLLLYCYIHLEEGKVDINKYIAVGKLEFFLEKFRFIYKVRFFMLEFLVKYIKLFFYFCII